MQKTTGTSTIFSPLVRKTINLFSVGRISGAPLTISVPILGALSLGQSLTSTDILGLGSIGLCAHLFGFSLNDIIDYPIDCTVPYRKSHPLVTKRISMKEAWIFAVMQIPIAIGIYIIALDVSRTGAFLMLLSIATSAIYNLWSKRGKIPRYFAELSLALSIGFLCCFGAATQSTIISLQSVLFSLTLAILLFLLNSVPSGLKDIKTDENFNVESFVIASGCRMVGDDGIFIPKKIWWFVFSLQFIVILCFVILGSHYHPSWFVVILTSALLLFSTLHLRLILTISSFEALQRSSPMLV